MHLDIDRILQAYSSLGFIPCFKAYVSRRGNNCYACPISAICMAEGILSFDDFRYGIRNEIDERILIDRICSYLNISKSYLQGFFDSIEDFNQNLLIGNKSYTLGYQDGSIITSKLKNVYKRELDTSYVNVSLSPTA